jgi:hypothetical protein
MNQEQEKEISPGNHLARVKIIIEVNAKVVLKYDLNGGIEEVVELVEIDDVLDLGDIKEVLSLIS